MSKSPSISFRRAGRKDIPFLAESEWQASIPPDTRSFWDYLASPFGCSGRGLLAALLESGAHAWGKPQDHWILEVEETPAASCALLKPDPHCGDHRPILWEEFPRAAQALGWSSSDVADFRRLFDGVFGGPQLPHLRPQASAILESVAVRPAWQGQGLGRRLLERVIEAARQDGHPDIGILIIEGNEPARRLYTKLGFRPFVTYHESYFGGEAPGMVKFRMVLKDHPEES